MELPILKGMNSIVFAATKDRINQYIVYSIEYRVYSQEKNEYKLWVSKTEKILFSCSLYLILNCF